MNKERKTVLIQLGLFIVTLICTIFAGMEWVTGKTILMGWDLDALIKGFIWYAFPFLAFLTVHELGHFFMAKAKKVKVTLPYYIPLWIPGISFGTMGALIRIKEVIKSRNNYFDIGVAGPLAGFVVALFFIIYGYSNLPDHDFIFGIHSEYEQYGAAYGDYVYEGKEAFGALRIGDSLLSGWVKDTFADSNRLPHINELAHYPFILAGFLGLFFTALNLLPIGQLDGGHILFSLIGEKNFNIVSPVLFTLFIFYAGLGFYTFDEVRGLVNQDEFRPMVNFIVYIYVIYLSFSKITKDRKTNLIIALTMVLLQLGVSYFFPNALGYSGFLAFGLLLGRVLGIYHPPVLVSEPMNKTRTLLGWLSLAIFVLCASPTPFY